MVLSAIRHLIQRARDAKDEGLQQRKRLQRAMVQASSYEEWSVAATKLDQLEGISPEEKRTRWKRETRLYDRRLLEERLRHLRTVRKGGRISEMMFAVRADLIRNLGNMTNRCDEVAACILKRISGLEPSMPYLTLLAEAKILMPASHLKVPKSFIEAVLMRIQVTHIQVTPADLSGMGVMFQGLSV